MRIQILAAAVLCAALSFSASRSDGAREQADIIYRTVEEQPLRMDAYWPSGDGPFPAVLCIHGGGWRSGSKEDMRNFCRILVREGFACFSVQYRLVPKSHFPAPIEDCARALQFLRSKAAEFRIDPKRIGVTGASAGGHLSALLAVMDDRARPDAADPVERQSTRVSCAAPFFGPMLLTKDAEVPEVARKIFDEFLGEGASEETMRAASPLCWVSSDDPPFLLIHGTADVLVPIIHSRVMDLRLRAARVESELVSVEGGGHGDFLLSQPKGEYWTKLFAFLRKHLGRTENR